MVNFVVLIVVEGFLSWERLCIVVCGLFYIGVVIEIGDVWVWGMEGGLGLCFGIGFLGVKSGDVFMLVWVFGEFLVKCNFVMGFKGILCGVVYMIMVFNKGKDIWVWGCG